MAGSRKPGVLGLESEIQDMDYSSMNLGISLLPGPVGLNGGDSNDFSKPSSAPSHVRYLLNQSNPKITLHELTWAPIIINGRTKKEISSSNTSTVSEKCSTYQRNSEPRLAWLFGRAVGHSLVKFHTPVLKLFPDPTPKFLRVEVKRGSTYAAALGEPNLMVIAPTRI